MFPGSRSSASGVCVGISVPTSLLGALSFSPVAFLAKSLWKVLGCVVHLFGLSVSMMQRQLLGRRLQVMHVPLLALKSLWQYLHLILACRVSIVPLGMSGWGVSVRFHLPVPPMDFDSVLL